MTKHQVNELTLLPSQKTFTPQGFLVVWGPAKSSSVQLINGSDVSNGASVRISSGHCPTRIRTNLDFTF